MLDELCSFERETGSPGERAAADWLVERLGEQGAPGAVEEESLHDTFWWPLGLAAGAGIAAGLLGLRGRRLTGAALGTLAFAAAVDDLPPGGRRLRSLLPKRRASNVVASVGPADAERTVVIVAHHDAAHSGLVFNPAIPNKINEWNPEIFKKGNTSPPLMWPVVGAPLVSAVGSLLGSRALAKAGIVLSTGVAAAMADLGMHSVVPGANDNGTGVVTLIALARALAETPTESVRVMLVSTSEEGLCEGMSAFAARHFPELQPERTFILSVDTVGSPHLLFLRGEGMFGITDYPADSLALVDGVAEELGIPLMPNLRLQNATDGVIALAAGYPCAAMCSVTDLKQPANYHWPTDVPENVDYATLADACRLVEAIVRRLDSDWL
jgi:Zn-dependent M28 family amino/carboxypeptidase